MLILPQLPLPNNDSLADTESLLCFLPLLGCRFNAGNCLLELTVSTRPCENRVQLADLVGACAKFHSILALVPEAEG